jgi:hypothetical protein
MAVVYGGNPTTWWNTRQVDVLQRLFLSMGKIWGKHWPRKPHVGTIPLWRLFSVTLILEGICSVIAM